mgnify:CR=1 FL=1
MIKFRVYIQDSELVHGTVDSDSQIKHLINIESDDAEKSIIVEIDHIYEQFKDVIDKLNGQTFEVHENVSAQLLQQLNIEGHEEFYHLIVE